MRKVTLVAFLLCLVTTCGAGQQEVVQYAKIRNAGSLSGNVADAAGVPIPQVRVCEMSANSEIELQCTTTDSQGQWSLTARKDTEVYRLRFAKNSFNHVWLRVRLTKRKAAPLTITLPVAM